MSTSDVRNIDALEDLRVGILKMADSWVKSLQEIRIAIHRAEDHFTNQVPKHWRHETQLAERELTESLDNLQQKQSAARASDRVSALEAQKRVRRAKDRLNLCRERARTAKAVSIEIKHQCDEILGPLADMADQSDNQLPAAAIQLGGFLDALRRYSESSQSLPPDGPATET